MNYTGIDGCRGGWLVCSLDEVNQIKVKLYPAIIDSIEVIKQSSVVSIDMPIGLVSSIEEARDCDALIRKELGSPYSSSVFNVPCYQAVYANDYKEANRINKEVLGKGLSIQSWNIVPKIKELDRIISRNPDLKKYMFEGHPELCFKYLKGESLKHKKKTAEGREERLKLLKQKLPSIEKQFESIRKQFLKKDVADDDIIDSIVLAINAKEIANNNFIKFPSIEQKNKDGITMEVVIGLMK